MAISQTKLAAQSAPFILNREDYLFLGKARVKQIIADHHCACFVIWGINEEGWDEVPLQPYIEATVDSTPQETIATMNASALNLWRELYAKLGILWLGYQTPDAAYAGLEINGVITGASVCRRAASDPLQTFKAA